MSTYSHLRQSPWLTGVFCWGHGERQLQPPSSVSVEKDIIFRSTASVLCNKNQNICCSNDTLISWDHKVSITSADEEFLPAHNVILTRGILTVHSSPPNLLFICRSIFWAILFNFCCWEIVRTLMAWQKNPKGKTFTFNLLWKIEIILPTVQSYTLISSNSQQVMHKHDKQHKPGMGWDFWHSRASWWHYRGRLCCRLWCTLQAAYLAAYRQIKKTHTQDGLHCLVSLVQWHQTFQHGQSGTAVYVSCVPPIRAFNSNDRVR